MAALTPAKAWRERIDRWIAVARATRDTATLRGQAEWFDRIRPRLTAVPEADRTDMATQLRATLSDLGA